MTAEEIIELLKLEPLPGEGGFFRETYRSSDKLEQQGLPQRFSEDRSASTAIYYLLTPESFSAMHRIHIDEVFHFYLGDPVEMLQIFPDKTAKTVIMGNDLAKGQQPQVVVAANVWQGSRLVDGGQFALLGTTVAPGFEFKDMQTEGYEKLAGEFPAVKNKLKKFTVR